MIAQTKRFRKGGRPRVTISAILLLLFLFVAAGCLAFSSWRIRNKRTELETQIKQHQEESKSLEEKNQALKAKISRFKNKDLIEKEARERLSLKKPGEEVVVVLPPVPSPPVVKNEEKGFFLAIWEEILALFQR